MLFNSMIPMKEGRATDEMTEEQITLLRLLKSTGLDTKSISFAYEKLDKLEQSVRGFENYNPKIVKVGDSMLYEL